MRPRTSEQSLRFDWKGCTTCHVFARETLQTFPCQSSCSLGFRDPSLTLYLCQPLLPSNRIILLKSNDEAVCALIYRLKSWRRRCVCIPNPRVESTLYSLRRRVHSTTIAYRPWFPGRGIIQEVCIHQGPAGYGCSAEL